MLCGDERPRRTACGEPVAVAAIGFNGGRAGFSRGNGLGKRGRDFKDGVTGGYGLACEGCFPFLRTFCQE